MAFNFPEGSSQQFSQTFASAKTITAASNASPAVLTSVAHGYTTGDEVLFTSGWEDATNTVYKITVLTADTFSVTGLNTVNTNFYPVGAGVGTTQKVSGWTAIPQVISIDASGGGPRFTDVQLLSSRNAIKVPTGFEATTTTLSLAHDATLAGYITMLDISRSLTKVAFKQVLGSGAITYGYGYLATSEFPKLNANNVNTVDSVMALLGRAISY